MFQIDKTLYKLCFHFRIAFTDYGIYKDHHTSDLIWFSFENDYFSEDRFRIAPRFHTYEALFHFITEEFYRKWNPS